MNYKKIRTLATISEEKLKNYLNAVGVEFVKLEKEEIGGGINKKIYEFNLFFKQRGENKVEKYMFFECIY